MQLHDIAALGERLQNETQNQPDDKANFIFTDHITHSIYIHTHTHTHTHATYTFSIIQTVDKADFVFS